MEGIRRSVFRTEPKILWQDMLDQSQVNVLRENCVIVSVTTRIAHEVTLGTPVVSRVRLRGLEVPSPDHRTRVTCSRTITIKCNDRGTQQ